MTTTRQGWGVGMITLVLYPFGAGAMALNFYFAGMLGAWVGLPFMTPGWSLIWGAITGVPATWLFARHIRKLMDRADAS